MAYARGTAHAAAAEPSYSELARAVHAFLARTPAPLVGVGLDDLAGDDRRQRLLPANDN